MKLMPIYLRRRSDKHTPKLHFQTKNIYGNSKSFAPQTTGIKFVTDIKC